MNLKKLIERLGANDEEDTEDNGFMSYSGEVHAAALGFSHGARDPFNLSPKELPQGDTEHEIDCRKEPGYYRAAFVVGTLAQLTLLGVGAVAANYVGLLPF